MCNVYRVPQLESVGQIDVRALFPVFVTCFDRKICNISKENGRNEKEKKRENTRFIH